MLKYLKKCLKLHNIAKCQSNIIKFLLKLQKTAVLRFHLSNLSAAR